MLVGAKDLTLLMSFYLFAEIISCFFCFRSETANYSRFCKLLSASFASKAVCGQVFVVRLEFWLDA